MNTDEDHPIVIDSKCHSFLYQFPPLHIFIYQLSRSRWTGIIDSTLSVLSNNLSKYLNELDGVGGRVTRSVEMK